MIFYENTEKAYDNEKFYKLQGYLDEKIAKETLGEFLFNNLGITVELLFGLKLFPFQEIILRSYFEHNFNMGVVSRGGSKSWTAALFACLYPIFYPGTKVVISSNSFRATRRIINQVEKFINANGADLLKQCYHAKKGKLEFVRRADEMVLEINEGSIVALPLNEKIRGTRADVLICDEFLQIPEDIYKFVLMPFLTAKSNIQEQLKIQEIEDGLIASGEITEEDRTILGTSKKIIALTSASYDFEFAYRIYSEWVDNITNKNKVKSDNRSYFVYRLGYQALPTELIEKDIAEEAKAGGDSSAAFQREYCAIFSSSSDGYFDYKKLVECTVKDGELPCVQLKGTKDSKYLVAIDPSFSSSKSSDNFCISVWLLNSDNRIITQVHTYAVAGGELNQHIKYFLYIMLHFNVIYVIADLGGTGFNFIEACNQSSLFQERNVNLKFIEGDLDSDDYLTEVKKARNSYRELDRTICYRQIFKSDWLRKSNEYLQSQISKKKIWFASKIGASEEMFKKASNEEYPIIFNDNSKNSGILDWIADQENDIEQTKRELALIECRATSLGTLQYDLPQHLRRSNNPDRARRDRYSCTLMAAWAAKCYWDIMFTEDDKVDFNFIPILI